MNKYFIKSAAAFALICGAPLLQAQVLGGGAARWTGRLAGRFARRRHGQRRWHGQRGRFARRQPRSWRRLAPSRDGCGRSHARNHRPRARSRRGHSRQRAGRRFVRGVVDQRGCVGCREWRRRFRDERGGQWHRGFDEWRGKCRGHREPGGLGRERCGQRQCRRRSHRQSRFGEGCRSDSRIAERPGHAGNPGSASRRDQTLGTQCAGQCQWQRFADR